VPRGYPPRVTDENDHVLSELSSFMDPNLEPAAATPEPEAIALDDATIALAQQVARPPWYASWIGAVAILVTPFLLLTAGVVGGDQNVQAWGLGGILFLFICGFPILGLPWLALFMSYRDRVGGIRNAISEQRAFSLTGPILQTGGRSIAVPGFNLSLVHRETIPAWAKTVPCTVVFADRTAKTKFAIQGTVISITGPGGRQAYPRTGAIPALLRTPAIVASILFSIGFTAACSAQSQSYGNAADRMRVIEAAPDCTKDTKPGTDCLRWMPGTVTRLEGYGVTGTSPQVNSWCSVMLRWAGGQQQGDIRVDGVDCTKQLVPNSAMPAQIEVVQKFAIQVRVGETVYQTDRWTPAGDTVFPLAMFFRVATLLWLAWPFIHVAAAILYRVSFPPAAQAFDAALIPPR